MSILYPNELPKPLTSDELDDLLKQTLHGPLPNSTQHRIFATLSSWQALLKKFTVHDCDNVFGKHPSWCRTCAAKRALGREDKRHD